MARHPLRTHVRLAASPNWTTLERLMTPDFAALRREFPVLTRKTYLNSGSYCALANSVRAAFDAYMDDRLRSARTGTSGS